MNAFSKRCFIISHFFLLILLDQSLLIAQQYPITHYTRDRGLPGNQVWNIFQDSKEYMWFATSSSLSKYNGKKYEKIDNQPGFPQESANSITEDKNNCIWIGFDQAPMSERKSLVHQVV